VNFQTRTI